MVSLSTLSLGLTISVKLYVDGWHGFPTYRGPPCLRMCVCFVLGLVCFGMPHVQPGLYWLWHSLWHAFMAASFYELYTQLEGGAGGQGGRRGGRRSRVRARQRGGR